MDADGSKKYESIDALIMAAEVLERAEAMAKEQFALKDNHEISNCCISNSNNNNSNDKCKIHGKYKENEQDGQLTEGLLDTIYYIKDLHTTERWTELFESKHKSDNRILFRELSDLKKKLRKVTGISNNSNKVTIIHKYEEDEDTSTASEDEDYNKYDSTNITDNVDDITDDASECEESLSRCPHSGHTLSTAIKDRIKNGRLTMADHLPDAKSYRSGITSRKRRHPTPRRHMSVTPGAHLSGDPTIPRAAVAAHHHRHSIGRTSLSLLNLHRAQKVRQPVDT